MQNHKPPYRFPVGEKVGTFVVRPVKGSPYVVFRDEKSQSFYKKFGLLEAEITPTPEFEEWARMNNVEYTLFVQRQESASYPIYADVLLIHFDDFYQAIKFSGEWL